MPIIVTPAIIQSFRDSKPAFTSLTLWPDDIVSEALCEGDVETGGAGWGAYEDICSNFKLRGWYYFAAHWLSVTYNTSNGATDPTVIDPIARLNTAAKSVGDESIQYRVGAIQSTEDDWLSLTNYGVQYLRLRRRAGMAARAV